MYEKQGVAEGSDGRDKHYYLRNNIWRVMDGDELVHEYTPDRYEVVGAKKLLSRFDDEGYDVTHVISPMGTVTYLYGKPDEDMDKSVAEGWKGELAGGTIGGIAGHVAGSAVGGPIGGIIGGAVGGTGGGIIGRELTKEEQLNELAPILAAGARLVITMAPKIAQVLKSTGKATAKAAAPVAKSGAEIAAKNADKIGVGLGAYEIGSSAADIAKAITAKVGTALEEKTIMELAQMAFKFAIPTGIVLAILYGGKKVIDSLFSNSNQQQGVAEGSYQSQYKSKEEAIQYAKQKVKTFRDPDDRIEIWSMPDGGFDVVHNMNSNGRNHCIDNGGKKLGTISPRQQGAAEDQVDEEKDACYNKVKSRYKVWPSAYASGALVKCRKVGASNWGNSSKK